MKSMSQSLLDDSMSLCGGSLDLNISAGHSGMGKSPWEVDSLKHRNPFLSRAARVISRLHIPQTEKGEAHLHDHYRN